MDSEPSYLASLGEFATLKNAIGSWYHQDAYVDFTADAEIWTSMWAGYDEAGRRRLVDQLEKLLSVTTVSSARGFGASCWNILSPTATWLAIPRLATATRSRCCCRSSVEARELTLVRRGSRLPFAPSRTFLGQCRPIQLDGMRVVFTVSRHACSLSMALLRPEQTRF